MWRVDHIRLLETYTTIKNKETKWTKPSKKVGARYPLATQKTGTSKERNPPAAFSFSEWREASKGAANVKQMGCVTTAWRS